MVKINSCAKFPLQDVKKEEIALITSTILVTTLIVYQDITEMSVNPFVHQSVHLFVHPC